MKSIVWWGAVFGALAVTLGYAWGEGLWTGRWRPSDVAPLAAARLNTVPLSVGDWEGADIEFNESQLALGELDGYLHRVYVHRSTGDQVQLLIVCGRAGPVSLHTPDVCYRGLGFSTLSKPRREALVLGDDDEGDAACWTADFQKSTPLGREFLRIAWTWLAGQRWQAPDQPRFQFATEPFLFKAYLIHPLHKEGIPWDDDPIPRLAKDLLPTLTRHLAATAAPSLESSAAEEEQSPIDLPNPTSEARDSKKIQSTNP